MGCESTNGGAGTRNELAEGYDVPPLLVGGWQLSRGHHSQEHDADGVIQGLLRCLDAGFTCFDCADIYLGVEELLGELRRQALKERGRAAADRIQIHTKYVPDRDDLGTITRADVERSIDGSLQRLGVERLDLVQFAWWDLGIPHYVQVAMWLMELQEDGKIHLLGATNFDVPSFRNMLDAGVPLVAHQVQYSVLDHRPERAGMVELCRQHGVSLLCYGTLAGGLLSGGYRGTAPPEEPFDNRSLRKYMLIVQEFGGWEPFQRLLEVLHVIAEKHEVSLANVAVRAVLDRPQVAGAIVGFRTDRHLEDNSRALSFSLDTTDHAAIDAACDSAPGPTGDVFELERSPGSPHAAIMKHNLGRSRS